MSSNPTSATVTSGSSTSATSAAPAIPAAPVIPAPKRGGVHPIYGPYVGGAALTNDYQLEHTDTFSFASQVRNLKQIQLNESTLKAYMNDITKLKFDGKLDPNSESSNELDKEKFIELIRENIRYFGLETFFYLQLNLTVVDLLEHSHAFDYTQVLAEHDTRMLPTVLMDAAGAEVSVSGNPPTAASLALAIQDYDFYEKADRALSRLAVESCVSPRLRQEIRTRFGHLTGFQHYPGQVYFMLVLDVCHASSSTDIDTAKNNFNALLLSNFAGENISSFSTATLKTIQVMKLGYALENDLSSKILRKVSKTSSEYFNRIVFEKLSKVYTFERNYKLRNPKDMETDADYGNLGPVGICAFISTEYSNLVKDHAWPALTATKPSGNYTHISSGSTDGGSNKGGSKRSKKQGNGQSPINENHKWRYVKPTDENQILKDGKGKEWKWCSKCVCRFTGNTGFYNRTHTTQEHKTKTQSTTSTSSTNTPPTDPVDMAAAAAAAATSNGSSTSNDLAANNNPTSSNVTSNGTSDSSSVNNASINNRNNQLEWSGAWCTIIDDQHNASPTESTAPSSDSNALIDAEADVFGFNTSIIDTSTAAENSLPTTVTLEGPSLLKSTSCSVVLDHPPVPPICNPSGNCFCIPAAVSLIEPIPVSGPKESISDDHYFDCLSIEMEECVDPDIFFDCLELDDPPSYAPPSDDTSWEETYLSDSNSLFTFMIPGFGWLWFYISFLQSQGFTWMLASIYSTFLLSYRILATWLPVYYGIVLWDGVLFWLLFLSVIFWDTILHLRDLLLLASVASIYQWFCSSVSTTWRLILNGWIYGLTMFSSLSSKIYNDISKDIIQCASFITWKFPWLQLHHYFDPSTPITSPLPYWKSSRRASHKSKSNLIHSFPRRWLILSCYMLLPFGSRQLPLAAHIDSFYSGLHYGVLTASVPFTATHLRLTRLSSLVELSPLVIYDYHRLQWYGLFYPDCNPWLDCADDGYAGDHSPVTPASFGQYGTFSNDLDIHDSYFDCVMEEDDLDEFFVALEELLPTHLPHLFDYSNLLESVINVKCDCHDFHPSEVLPTVSTNAYMAMMNGLSSDLLTPTKSNFPIIFDSGASRSISGCLDDFISPPTPPPHALTLGGMAQGMEITGIGTVRWSFNTGSQCIVVQTQCYYVPKAEVRLLSPQRLFNKSAGSGGMFAVKEEMAQLDFTNLPTLNIPYDERSYLPIGIAKNSPLQESPQLNVSVTDESNRNLTAAQKLLLSWHYRFGHLNFQALQTIFKSLPFVKSLPFLAASRCDLPKCEACAYAKAHRRPAKGIKQQVDVEVEGHLKQNHLRPGQAVSMDHFESRLKGRTYTSFGKTTSDQYKGGCTFVDHMSGYIHVEHQLGFSGVEAIRAKQNFEQMALVHGVLIQEYHADNGIFKAKDYVTELRELHQPIGYCGVGAHHQNGIAERSIRTVSDIARSLILHAAMHWKDGIDSSL